MPRTESKSAGTVIALAVDPNIGKSVINFAHAPQTSFFFHSVFHVQVSASTRGLVAPALTLPPSGAAYLRTCTGARHADRFCGPLRSRRRQSQRGRLDADRARARPHLAGN